MDIYKALEKLNGFYDMLANTGVCTDEELELISEIEDVIYKFANKYEPRAEDLPMEYTCDCGHRMHCNQITPEGDAEFICENCNAIWYFGR